MPYLLIDGNSIVHAAQHSTKLSSDGRPTHAIFGFLKTLRVTLKTYPRYDNVLVLWDTKSDWRLELFPGYKGERDRDEKQIQARKEIGQQKPSLIKGVQMLGVDQVLAAGFEADDLAGYYCRLAVENAEMVKLISGDEDWIQLVNGYVSWVDPRKGGAKKCNRMSFEAMTGCRDGGMFLESKALQGDKSDSIGGVKGIGPKTATGLLMHFNGLMNAIKVYKENGNQIPKDMLPEEIRRAHKAVNRMLEPENVAIIKRNMHLMSLRTSKRDSQIKERLTIKPGKYDWGNFQDWCMENEFASIVQSRAAWEQVFGDKR